MAMGAQLLGRVWLFPTSWTVTHQAPLSMGFPKEYWSGMSFLSPGALPDLGIEPGSPASPALACGFFTTAPPHGLWSMGSQRVGHNWAPVGVIIIRWMAMCGTDLSIHSLYHLSTLSVIYYLFLLSFTYPLSIIYRLSISPSIFLVSHCCYQQCCSEDQWMDFFECMSKYVYDRLVEVVFLGQRDSAFQILQSCSPKSLHQFCSPVWTTLPVFPHIFVGSILKTKIVRPSYIYCL